jgi:ABC-2 type transport system permease protein
MVKQEKKINLRARALTQLVLLTGILLMLNFIGSIWFTRIDLTGDKRFTLSEQSRKIVGNLKDVVYIKVYLEGDFSPGFTRLKESTREMLDELRTYSKGNLEYEFIDPAANTDETERDKLYAQLYQKGIQPTTLEERTAEGVNRKYIWPGAIISFSNQELGVQLLKDQIGLQPEVMLNNSIQNLEYEIVNGISKVTNPLQPAIAFISGHGELNEVQTADISMTLKNSYVVERLAIDGKLSALDKYKAVIIAKPDSAFNEKDKFILDQYIMKGGKVVWLLDQMQVSMDSLSGKGETMALARQLNLDDMLFRYGVRLNYDLVQDIVSSLIPVVTGTIGNTPKQQLMPWYYFPLMNPYSKHPIVNNLNAVRAQFISTMDTIAVQGVEKSVLLTSSRYSRISTAPARVSLGIMEFKPDPSMFPQSFLLTGVLMEGEFTSNFKNRIPPVVAQDTAIGFKEKSKKTAMVVVSDGDIIRNDIAKGNPVPLGVDKYTGATYGNKAFMQNVMDYLCDDSGLMVVRNKEFRLRLLDPAILDESKLTLQVVNTVVPVSLILLFGIVKMYLRRRRYAA